MKSINNCKIGVVGLGYVGLPLAVEFGQTIATIGLDINKARVAELKAGQDTSLETTPEELVAAKHLSYTDIPGDASECDVYVVTVPTPVSESKQPDLSPLIGASQMLGTLINSGDLVCVTSIFLANARTRKALMLR